MTLKQTLNSLSAPDGSHYVTLTDGAGNLSPAGSSAGTTSNATSGVAVTSTNIPAVDYNYVWNSTTSTWDQATGLLIGTPGAPTVDVVTVQSPSSGGAFPAGAVPVTISATGTTGAVAAVLPAAAAKTTYVAGFSITSDAVAGLSGNATMAGVISGTMTYIQGVGVAPAVASLTQTFNPPIPSSAVNTAITVTSAAAGTGGTTAVNVWGYQQ